LIVTKLRKQSGSGLEVVGQGYACYIVKGSMMQDHAECRKNSPSF